MSFGSNNQTLKTPWQNNSNDKKNYLNYTKLKTTLQLESKKRDHKRANPKSSNDKSSFLSVRKSQYETYYYVFKVQNHNLIDLNISLSWSIQTDMNHIIRWFCSRILFPFPSFRQLVRCYSIDTIFNCGVSPWVHTALYCVLLLYKWNEVLLNKVTVYMLHNHRYWAIFVNNTKQSE